jgi:hypothetical protein
MFLLKLPNFNLFKYQENHIDSCDYMSRQRIATQDKANEVMYNIARKVAPEEAQRVNAFRRTLRRARAVRTIADSTFVGSLIAMSVTHGTSFRDAFASAALTGSAAAVAHIIASSRKERYEIAEHQMVQGVKNVYFGGGHVELVSIRR